MNPASSPHLTPPLPPIDRAKTKSDRFLSSNELFYACAVCILMLESGRMLSSYSRGWLHFGPPPPYILSIHLDRGGAPPTRAGGYTSRAPAHLRPKAPHRHAADHQPHHESDQKLPHVWRHVRALPEGSGVAPNKRKTANDRMCTHVDVDTSNSVRWIVEDQNKTTQERLVLNERQRRVLV